MDDYYRVAAELYDQTAAGVTGDVEFYRELAVASGGPAVELGVGTGRVAVPTALAGVEVIGIDREPAMLAVARRHAREAGVEARIDLREGDMCDFALETPAPLVTIPHRSFLHNLTVEDQRATLEACRRALQPGGRLALNVFNPDLALIARWHGRSARHYEPHDAAWRVGEHNDYRDDAPVVTTRLRWREGGRTRRASYAVRYVYPEEMRGLLTEAGLEVETLLGDFAGSPFGAQSTEQIWVARRP